MPFDLTPTVFRFRDDPEDENQLQLEGQLPDLGLPDLSGVLNRRQGPPPTGPRLDQAGQRPPSPLSGMVTGAAGAAARSLTEGTVSPEPFQGRRVAPQAQQAQAQQAPEDQGFIGASFKRGLEMTRVLFGNVLENMPVVPPPTTSAPGIDLEGLFRSEEAQLLRKEQGRRMEQEALQAMKSIETGEADNALEWFLGVNAEQLPIMATIFAGGGAAALMGFNPLVGAAAVAYPLHQALMKDELMEEGVSEENATIIGSAAAVPLSALEAAVEAAFGGAAAKRLMGGSLKRAFKDRLLRIAQGFGLGTVGEGLTEGSQEGLAGLTVKMATGEFPENMGQRILYGAGVGAVAGGTFGTAVTGAVEVGDAALQSYRKDSSQKEIVTRRAQAAAFDPDAADPGTQVGNKTKVELSNGQTRWRTVKEDGTLGPFAKAPSREEVREHFTGESDAARQAAATAEETVEREPVKVPVAQAAQRLSETADREVSPATVEMNVRYLSANYISSASRDLENLSEADYASKKARLEEIALSEETDADYSTRLTALSQLRAMELMENQAQASRQGPLDYSRAARAIAEMDELDFQAFRDYTLADGREEEIRILNEAQLMRDNLEEFEVEAASRQVRSRLDRAETTPSRGVTDGSQVVTESGEVGEVVGVDPSGMLQVKWQDSPQTQTVSPEQVRPIPTPGTTARLADGTAVTVESIQDNTATVVMPSGNTNIVEIGQISEAGDATVARAAQEADIEEATEAAVAAERGDFLDLPEPLTAIDRRTGQEVTLTGIGASSDVMRTSDGSVMARDDIQFPSEPAVGTSTIAEIRESGGPIPTFQPGTQPSGEGRHINFIRVPKGADSDYFEQQIRGTAGPSSNLSPSVILGIVEVQPTILPQPYKPGYVTYAVEVPASNRELTDASKRLLRHISGRPAGKITASTLKSGFRLTGAPSPDETSVMRVPDALLAAVDHTNQDVDYLRRLTDLSFQISPELGQAYTEAADASVEARDARISGDDLGEAEMAEIRAAVKNYEIAQQALKEEVATRRRFWDIIKEELRDLMSPQEVNLIDALNSIDEQTLAENIPGVGPARARRIIEAREERGGFEQLSDLLEIERIGEGTIGPEFQEALTKAAIEGSGDIVNERNERIKTYLKALPARESGSADGFYLAFEHPDVPGLHLLLDKETIPSSTTDAEGARQPTTRDVFHIRFITPEGKEVRGRTLGSEETSLQVPRHLLPRAQDLINEALQEEVPAHIIEDELQSQRRTTEVATIVDETGAEKKFDILGRDIDPETGTEAITLEDPESGEAFQIDPKQVASTTSTPEKLVDIRFPRRLTPDEIAGSVLREILDFRGTAKLFSVGQWRSNIPGVWGDIRQRTDGTWQAIMMEQPVDARTRRFGTSEIKAMDVFKDRSEAEAWLREHDFAPLRIEHNAVRLFEDLPPVEEVSNQESDTWNMYNVNKELGAILDMYWQNGFVPPAVRDYATRFATRWVKQGLESRHTRLFSYNGLRALGLFTPHSATAAAQSLNPHAMVQEASQPTVEIDGNEVIINRPTASERADNTTVLNGLLLTPGTSLADPATMERAKKIFEADLHKERFFDLTDLDNATLQDRIVRVGRVASNRQLGVVMGYSPNNDVVTVQVWDSEGKPLIKTVPESHVKRTRGSKETDALRAARDSMGEAFNIPSTPEMGDSPIDRKLDLGGVTDREKYIKGLRSRVARILKGVKIADDGTIVGDAATAIDQLVPIWIRMKELEISNRKDEMEIPSALVGDTETSGTLVWEAKQEIKNTFSNISPYGELMARAKLGLLPVDKRRQISDQAEEFGVDPELPLYRQVEWLMQNVWDPSVAQYMMQLRRDIGAAGWLNALREHFPGQLIEMRIPAMGTMVNTNGWLNGFTMPRTVANRHPTMKMFHFLSEKARTEYGLTAKEGEEILKALKGEPGMSLKRRQTLDDLLQHEALGAAQERPSQILTRQEVLDALPAEAKKALNGWNWYGPYRTLREFMTRGLRENKRNALVRGMHPVDITEGLQSDDAEAIDKAQRTLAVDYGLSIEEIEALRQRMIAGESFWALNRNSDARYARPRSEVEAFLNLQEDHASYADVPEEVRPTMTDWMREEYDFWARFGINNYAPRILQGSHIIKLKTTEGEDKMVAFAPDGQTAQDFFLRVSQGDFADKGLLPSDVDNLYLEYRKPSPDEVDPMYLNPEKMSRVWARMVKEGGEDGVATRMARVAFKELNLSGDPAAPRGLHNQARVSDLSDIIEDPFERYLVYWVRTARNNFLLDIEHAYETARGVDFQISRARGVDPVFPHRGQTHHDSNTRKYMDALRDSYVGNMTEFQKNFSSALAWVTTPARLTSTQLRGFIERARGNPDFKAWQDPAFLDALYNPEYTTRRWAASMTGFQSLWRLGFNLGGSLINMSQHGLFTPGYLISRGADPLQAHGLALKGGTVDIKDYLRATRGGKSERGQELAEFAHKVGVSVVPARGTAAPGLNIRSTGRPIKFSDDGWVGSFAKDLDWAAMLPFGTAERYVRLSSAFAARRYAQELGLPEGAQVAFARDAVDNTQFQYYDQALPPLMRGSGVRVLTQFKQFPANAMKYEWDLMKGVVGGKFRGERTVASPTGRKSARSQAAKALVFFNLGLMGAGGATIGALKPILAPLIALLPHLGLSKGEDIEETIMNTFGRHEERMLSDAGPAVPDPNFFDLHNFFLYGAAGLLDLQIAQRLSVSGLSLDPSRLTDLAGPSGAMYIDYYKGMFGEGGFVKINPKATFMGLGAAAATRMLLGSKAPPMTGLGLAMGFTELASLTTDAPFRKWARGTPEGRRMIGSLLPTGLRNGSAAMDIFDDPSTLAFFDDPRHETLDQNLNAHEYPGTLNSNFEALTRLTGLQTVRSAEERAYQNYLRSSARKRAEVKRSITDQVASSVMETHDDSALANLLRRITGGSEDPSSLLTPENTALLEYARNSLGVDVDKDDIIREVNRRRADPTERARESEPLPTRGQMLRNR